MQHCAPVVRSGITAIHPVPLQEYVLPYRRSYSSTDLLHLKSFSGSDPLLHGRDIDLRLLLSNDVAIKHSCAGASISEKQVAGQRVLQSPHLRQALLGSLWPGRHSPMRIERLLRDEADLRLPLH